MKVHKILVPVRGNSTDEQVIKFACLLAKKTKATIYTLYVIEIDRSLPLEARIDNEIERAEAVLSQASNFADEQDYEIETEILQAREAALAIVDEAIEKEVDLIILGLPYKKRFGLFTQGTTVRYVLKNAPCPVLVYRERIK